MIAAAALALGLSRPAEGRDITGDDVRRAIEKGVKSLKRAEKDLPLGPMNRGQDALIALALHQAGVPVDDAYLNKLIGSCAGDAGSWTYSIALTIMLLQSVDAVRYKATIQKYAEMLIDGQSGNGMWTYQAGRNAGGGGDGSNTQFALLGLHAARLAGVKIPARVWEKSLEHYRKSQSRLGGWGYGHGGQDLAYGSMTCAGIASVYICGGQLHQPKSCGVFEQNKMLAAGLAWLNERFSVQGNPVEGQNINANRPTTYYYHYALERVGMLSGQKFIGSHDWYKEGAEHIVGAQQPDGGWGSAIETSFALLFLAKGNAPLLVNKLKWSGDWSNDLHDVKNLVEAFGKERKTIFAWQVLPAESSVDEYLYAPILYFNGHKPPDLDGETCKRLKEFIDEGGMIVAEACCGSKEFDAGFRKLMDRLFPGRELDKLPDDHDVYFSQFKIPQPEAHVLEGLSYACRTPVLYSPKDLSCAWDVQCPGEAGQPDRTVALQLGQNILAYALGDLPLRDKLQKITRSKPGEINSEEVVRNAFVLAQIKHGGDWNPDPMAWVKLSDQLRTKANLNLVKTKRPIDLLDPNLWSFPFLYLTGHEGFAWSEDERKRLRSYLENGGFLFAESCCGEEAFTKSFRQQIALVLHDAPVLPLSETDVLYTTGNDIRQVGYTSALLKAHPGLRTPTLESAVLKGKPVVVFSPHAVGCRIENHHCPNCKGYDQETAPKVFMNVVLYALTR